MKTRADYLEYLKSDHWKTLRRAVLDRDGNQCTKCPSRKHLQVHHRFYRQRWEDSEPDDLVTLCNWCHEREHGVNVVRIIPPEAARKLVKKIRQRRKQWRRNVYSGRWSC